MLSLILPDAPHCSVDLEPHVLNWLQALQNYHDTNYFRKLNLRQFQWPYAPPIEFRWHDKDVLRNLNIFYMGHTIGCWISKEFIFREKKVAIVLAAPPVSMRVSIQAILYSRLHFKYIVRLYYFGQCSRGAVLGLYVFNRGGVLEGLVDRGIHCLLALRLNSISNN